MKLLHKLLIAVALGIPSLVSAAPCSTFSAGDLTYITKLNALAAGCDPTASNNWSLQRAAATGTVDVITATPSPALTLTDKIMVAIVSAGANTSTTPTFAPNGLTARTVTTRGGGPLVAGDIGPAGYVGLLEYNSANTRWELLNPAKSRIGSDVSGLGANVATALGVNIGSAGSPVVNGGVLGTPSSGVLTNLTGSPTLTAPNIGAATGTSLSLSGALTAQVRDKGGQVYNARSYGMVCDGATDDTSAFNTLLATIIPSGVGGGTIWISGVCRIDGAVVLPNDGAGSPKQGYVRITGGGSSANGYWTSLPASPARLDLRYSSGPKIDTRGAGVLEIDHITLSDGGSDCTAFINTTNTTLRIHDVAFSGTASGTSACNDAIVAGGTGTTVSGLSTAPFQGYGIVIQNNFFDKIRRGLYGKVYFNGAMIVNNTWSSSSGSNQTTAVASCTNASPTVCTVTGHGMSVGTTYSANFSGATGSWTAINGIHALTPITANTFSMAVNATAFGALAGSPVYLSGGAIELDGTGGGASPAESTVGNVISGNLVEMSSYPYFVKATNAVRNDFTDNQLFDAGGNTISYYVFFGGGFNHVKHGFGNDTSALIGEDATSLNNNSYTNTGQSQTSLWAQPWVFLNTVTLKNSINGVTTLDSSNNAWGTQIQSSGVVLGITTIPSGGSLETVAQFSRSSSTDKRLTLSGTTDSRLDATSQLRIYAKAGEALWLGDSSAQAYVLSGTIHSTRTGTTASLKMTNTGSVQWSGTSSVSAGSTVGITRNADRIMEINKGDASGSGNYGDLILRNLIPGATLSTSMTDGFVNIPGAAGTPSGTPANTTGYPMYYDATNDKICVYRGAWRCSGALL